MKNDDSAAMLIRHVMEGDNVYRRYQENIKIAIFAIQSKLEATCYFQIRWSLEALLDDPCREKASARSSISAGSILVEADVAAV
jgi:hypothetical protein